MNNNISFFYLSLAILFPVGSFFVFFLFMNLIKTKKTKKYSERFAKKIIESHDTSRAIEFSKDFVIM